MKNLVFVYGTLKRGHGNHWLLHGARWMGHARTKERAQMILAGFPVVMGVTELTQYRGQIGQVLGEVYEVDDATMVRLDRLEGEGHMYHRVEVPILSKRGVELRAWMYVGDERMWGGPNIYMPVNEKGLHEWPGGRTNRA